MLDVFLGLLVCAYKGIKIPFGNDKGMRDGWFGFKDSRLDSAWKRVHTDRSMHNLTNLIVEWNRLDAQRGAKVFCGLILTGMVLTHVTTRLL